MDLGIIILSEVSQRKTVSYDIAYMWNLKKKMTQWTYLQNRLTDLENELMVTRGKGWEGRDKQIHTSLFKIDNQWGPTV